MYLADFVDFCKTASEIQSGFDFSTDSRRAAVAKAGGIVV